MKNCLYALLSLLLLFSCNQQEPAEDCTDDFVTSYKEMGDSFVRSYRPFSTSKADLEDKLKSFLASHQDVTCTYEGETLAPTEEVQELLQQVQVQKRATSRSIAKVIYGDDDRTDVIDAVDERYKVWARSTMAQISLTSWDDSFNLDSRTIGESFGLCSDEPFRDQINPANCSGFLVAPNIVLTAGHCMQSMSDCSRFAWVTDFVAGVTTLRPEQIFSCKRIVKQVLDQQTGLDYAVVELDREVTDRKYFKMQTSEKVATGTPLVVIGHPSGLPTKVADGAVVRGNSEVEYFSANLDTYGGNSGSAVINTVTGEVEGILVRGEVDYVWKSDPVTGEACRTSNRCGDNECRGEDVTRISSVSDVPVVAANSAIRAAVFEKSGSVTSEGWFASFYNYSFGAVKIGGRKFLDRCGIHVYNSTSAQTWLHFHSGQCDESTSIDGVIASFSQEVYL